MNNFLKHPLTLTLLPLCIMSVIAYFGFVKDTTNTQTTLAISLEDIRNDLGKTEIDIEDLQRQIQVYAVLPPKVDKLEAVTTELQSKVESVLVNQSAQAQTLQHIHEGITDLKYTLREK